MFRVIIIVLFLYYTAPTASPTNFAGVVVDSITISVSWNHPPPEHRNGIIRMYQVNVVENETNTNFTVVSLNTSATITPLHPDYQYMITVKAVTVLPGPVSIALVLQTDEDGQYFSK